MSNPENTAPATAKPEALTPWQLIMLLASVFALAILLLDSTLNLTAETRKILAASDTFICFLFIGDFSWRLVNATDKKHFLVWNWIDLVSSIPMVDFLRVGRLVRIIRIIRLMRAFRSAKHLINIFLVNRSKSMFLSALCITLTLVVFSSIAMLNVEVGPDANIKDADDALWWAMTTITTVGYGDRFPTSGEGRILGAMLMIAGVGLFGTFTGFVASWFMSPNQPAVRDQKRAPQLKEGDIESRLSRIEEILEDLKRDLANGKNRS